MSHRFRTATAIFSDKAGELGCNADGAQRLFRSGVVEVSKMWECLAFETGVLRIHSNFIEIRKAVTVFHLECYTGIGVLHRGSLLCALVTTIIFRFMVRVPIV